MTDKIDLYDTRAQLCRSIGNDLTIITKKGELIKGKLKWVAHEEVHFRSGYCELVISTKDEIKKIPITDCVFINNAEPEQEQPYRDVDCNDLMLE